MSLIGQIGIFRTFTALVMNTYHTSETSGYRIIYADYICTCIHEA